MKDKDHHTERSVEEDLSTYQRVCNHLKKYIISKSFKFTEKQLKAEAATYNAQIKILTLFIKKNKPDLFVVDEGFEIPLHEVRDKALKLPLTSRLKKSILRLCSDEKALMSRTTLYTHLDVDLELKRLWKKREKSTEAPNKEKNQKKGQPNLTQDMKKCCELQEKNIAFLKSELESANTKFAVLMKQYEDATKFCEFLYLQYENAENEHESTKNEFAILKQKYEELQQKYEQLIANSFISDNRETSPQHASDGYGGGLNSYDARAKS